MLLLLSSTAHMRRVSAVVNTSMWKQTNVNTSQMSCDAVYVYNREVCRNSPIDQSNPIQCVLVLFARIVHSTMITYKLLHFKNASVISLPITTCFNLVHIRVKTWPFTISHFTTRRTAVYAGVHLPSHTGFCNGDFRPLQNLHPLTDHETADHSSHNQHLSILLRLFEAKYFDWNSNRETPMGAPKTGTLVATMCHLPWYLVCWVYHLNHVLILGRPLVKLFYLCYGTVVLSVCPVCDVGVTYYGQTVGWIKMKLGKGVGLGPGHNVLNGDLASPPKKGHSPSPIFGPCPLPYGWMDEDATWHGRIGLGLATLC